MVTNNSHSHFNRFYKRILCKITSLFKKKEVYPVYGYEETMRKHRKEVHERLQKQWEKLFETEEEKEWRIKGYKKQD